MEKAELLQSTNQNRLALLIDFIKNVPREEVTKVVGVFAIECIAFFSISGVISLINGRQSV